MFTYCRNPSAVRTSSAPGKTAAFIRSFWPESSKCRFRRKPLFSYRPSSGPLFRPLLRERKKEKPSDGLIHHPLNILEKKHFFLNRFFFVPPPPHRLPIRLRQYRFSKNGVKMLSSYNKIHNPTDFYKGFSRILTDFL